MKCPDWLGDFSKEDLKKLLDNDAKITVLYDNEIPVCSMMFIPSDKKFLEELELDFNTKEVADYGPMFVNKEYVGNGLQYQMPKKLDDYSIKKVCKYVLSTIHPDNKYSSNNFLKDNFKLYKTMKFKRGIREVYLKEL